MKSYTGVIVYQGEKTPLLEADGQPLLTTMVNSLRNSEVIGEVMVVAPPPNHNTEAMADLCRQIGVRFYPISKRRPFDILRIALSILKTGGAVVIPVSSPFVQDIAIRTGIDRLEKAGADFVTFNGFPQGLAPYSIMDLKYLVRGGVNVGIYTLTRGKIGQGLGNFTRGEGAHAETAKWADLYERPLSLSLRVDEEADVSRLKRLDIIHQNGRIKDMASFAERAEEAYLEALREELRTHPEPHLLNEKLNTLEMNMEKTELKSYPVSVGLNLTPVCNARCTFCTYEPSRLVRKDFVSMEAIEQMTWLKYVTNFYIWGGIGDSLVHPQFIDIFNYIRDTYPHLFLHLSTNAVSLTPEVSDALVGRMDGFNVSLNAASRETYKQLMRVDRWDTVYNNLKYLSEKRKEMGTTKPSMAASIVMTRENVEELEDFVDIAKSFGAEVITFVHYVTTTTVGERLLSAGSSLYYYKELADKHLAAAVRKAKSYKLTVTAPPLFSEEEGVNIVYGTRTKAPVWETCTDPWKMCYLTVNDVGATEMIFCCSGLYYHVEYDKSDLSEANLWRIWNHPAAQYFRRTTNHAGKNPICTFCKTKDRFDPESQEIYEVYNKLDPAFKKMSEKAAQQQIEGWVPLADLQ